MCDFDSIKKKSLPSSFLSVLLTHLILCVSVIPKFKGFLQVHVIDNTVAAEVCGSNQAAQPCALCHKCCIVHAEETKVSGCDMQ